MDGLKWRIYYDDGSTFSNLEGRFADAPSDGVLAVVEKDPQVGYVVYHGKDYYFKIPDDGTIGMADDLGPFLRRLGVIKFGRWAGRTTWGREWDRIVSESRRDFGKKSGETLTENG